MSIEWWINYRQSSSSSSIWIIYLNHSMLLGLTLLGRYFKNQKEIILHPFTNITLICRSWYFFGWLLLQEKSLSYTALADQQHHLTNKTKQAAFYWCNLMFVRKIHGLKWGGWVYYSKVSNKHPRTIIFRFLRTPSILILPPRLFT